MCTEEEENLCLNLSKKIIFGLDLACVGSKQRGEEQNLSGDKIETIECGLTR